MRLKYCGGATIDKQLYLRTSDEAFFDLVGQDIYGSVLDFIHIEDVARFKSAFDELLQGNVSRNAVMVRKQPVNLVETQWLVVGMKLEPFSQNGELLARLDFYSYKEQNASDGVQEVDKNIYEMFFEMTGGILLAYSSESDEIEIVAGMEEQTVSLYHGSFTKWKNEFMVGKVSTEYEEAFHALCEDITAGKASFKHDVKTSALSEDASENVFTFKCRTWDKEGEHFSVLGCITALEAVSTAGSSYVMDAGLPILSKRSIIEYAKNAFEKNQDKTYLVIVDLDDFKTINDTYGHMFGDEVLMRLVKVIKNAIGKSGMLGRIGGDELMIVLNWIESPVELRNMLRSIRTGVEWAFKGERDDFRLTCSIGVAAYPDNGDSYDKVFQLADRMLYIAKSKGKNRYVIYTPEIHDDSKVATDKSAPDRRKSALKEDKTGVIQRLIEEFMVRKIITYEAEFRELAACFELDRITMVYSNMAEAITLEDDVFTNVVDEKIYRNLEEGFVASFDKNNIFVMNGRFNVEGKAPELCKLLEAQGIESAIFYKLVKSGRTFGYVMFAKKSRRQMWSEYEKTLLGCAGKAFELSFFGK